MLIKPGLYCLVCYCCWSAAASGQESPSKEQAALVDGLLDLLNEPPPVTGQPPAGPPTLSAPTGGTTGSPLDSTEGHPLQTVRNNMLTAAGYLSKGNVNQQTQQLQSDIVVRLDELIEQLEKTQTPRQSQSQPQQQSKSSGQQESSTPQAPPQNSGAPPEGPAESDSEPEASADDPSPSTPGQQGREADATVDLLDPKTLQQDVWGQLPEQVRKQMQSRMVERFLPSYRQQIEAYFQALIEQPK